jgi:hypothetical protein
METKFRSSPKEAVQILPEEASRMREDLRTVERALERIQKEAAELAQHRNGSSEGY